MEIVAHIKKGEHDGKIEAFIKEKSERKQFATLQCEKCPGKSLVDVLSCSQLNITRLFYDELTQAWFFHKYL